MGASWPALTHTRDQSQIFVDIYNTRQLMAATALYSFEHNESLPGNAWGEENDSWAYAANIPTYGNATAATFPLFLSNQVEFCKRSQLFPYVRSVNVFKCPLDVTNQLYFYRLIYFNSYTWNGAVSGYGMLFDGSSFKITQFKPNCILQWESDEQNPFSVNDCSEFPNEGVSGRHGSGATVGLISGGTMRVPVSQWYSTKFAGPPNMGGQTIPSALLPNQLWCNPAKRNGLP
jgi:hypothetical protein